MAAILWLRVQGAVFEVERFVLLCSMGFTSLIIIHIHLSCRVLRLTSMQDVYEVKSLVDGLYFVQVYSDLSVDYLKMFLLNVPAAVVALGL